MRTSGLRAIAASMFSAVLIAACGGGGGSAPAADDAPGTVGILITDAPTNQWDEAIATINSVTLIGGGGQVNVFSGSATLDLLRLRDFSELFAVSETVPAGLYSKIRLELSDLVLNDVDEATGGVISSVHAQLAGNGNIDLNPRESFRVLPGGVLFIELDFDMDKSLKITQTGNGRIIVRPVIFVNIHGSRPDGRLSRIHGDITAVDALAGTLEVCQSGFASDWDDRVEPLHNSDDDDDEEGDDDSGDGNHDDDGDDDFGRDHCVTVSTDDATGIFGADGLPQDFSGLAVGEEATVIGRLRRAETPVPLDGLGTVLQFAFDAAVIEEGLLGTFQRIAGTAASTVDALTDRFGLDVAPGQGIATDAALPVQLYEHSRIFNRLGVELDRAAITIGRGALADGVLQVGAEDVLRSPLVILAPPLPLEAVLHGHILSVDTGAGSLMLATDSGDRCVDAADADVFLITSGAELSFARGTLADLEVGQNAAVFGTESDSGCLTAGTILAEAEVPI